MDAVPTTIFVNSKNNGRCVATIDADHVFTGGSYVIRPDGSYTQDNKFDPREIEKTIKISAIKTGNQEMTFTVVHNGSSLRGNITVTFFVTYE